MRGPLAADAQRWALELSQREALEARQATLATVPVHWQVTIRHYLVWRLGRVAWRDSLPGLRTVPIVPPASETVPPPSRSRD